MKIDMKTLSDVTNQFMSVKGNFLMMENKCSKLDELRKEVEVKN